MKKIIAEYLRTIIVSFEFLTILLGLAVSLYFPVELEALAKNIISEDEIVKYLTLLPSAFFIWTIKEAIALLFPNEKYVKVLHNWKDYWRLRIHFYVSVFYSLFFAVVGILVWIMGYKINEANGFLFLVSSVVGGFIVVSSVYFAKIRQKEILLKNSD
jgi:hypothetical protein